MFSHALLVNVPTVPGSWLTALGNAKVLIAVWSSGLVVYIIAILLWRKRRHAADLHASADAQPFAPAPDDGQTITVYANKSRVALYLLMRTIFTGVFVAFNVGVWSDPRFQRSIAEIVISDSLIAIVLLYYAAYLLLGAVRFFTDAPILVVSAVGITDNATFMATGTGLIPWREITEVFIYSNRVAPSILPARMLTVVARSNAIMRRQALWKRMLYPFPTSAPDVVRIREYLLPMPIEELHAQIEEYARAHGHTLRRPSWMPAAASPSGPSMGAD